MSARDTSAAAFHELEASGAIETQQELVLKALKGLGPSTGGEIAHAIMSGPDGALRWRAAHQTSTRLRALQKSGAVRECGKRKCSVTGMTVIEWEAV